MWAIAWVNHALLTQPLDLFSANIFFPAAQSLTFSEHLFGIAVLVHPWYWFSDNPFIPYNLLFLASYFVSAVGMYYLCLYYTGNARAAFVGGLIFGFAFFRPLHAGHLSLISNQWFPFIVLLFHKLRTCFRWPKAVVWIALVALQCLSNWYNAVFVLMILLWVIAADWIRDRGERRKWWPFGISALVIVALLLPFYLPYLRHQTPTDYGQQRGYAADWGSYLKPPVHTILGNTLTGQARQIWEERTAFVGYVPTGMAALAVVLARSGPHFWTYTSLAVAAFVLSAGPGNLDRAGLKRPAYYLYRLLPPLAQMRASGRFAIIVVFCVAVLASSLLSRISRRSWAAVISLAFLLEVFPIGLGLHPETAPTFRSRPLDVWLRANNVPQSGPLGWKHPKQSERKVVLELPHYGGDPPESRYMVFSTYHWMNLVNGYSRYYPPNFESDMRIYSQFPADEAVRLMKSRGVHYVVVHGDRYVDSFLGSLDAFATPVARFGNDRVYRIQ